MRTNSSLLVAMLALGCTAATAQSDLQRSHIEGNQPPAEVVESYLRRDLLKYFTESGYPTATSVNFTPLRFGPTQSGVSYPKYYFWVTVASGSASLTKGAVRVAAIERTHFEVTDFVPQAEIKARPEQLTAIFPASLIGPIIQRSAKE